MNELAKNLKCIVMRSGVELWVEAERIENLVKILETLKETKFISFNGQMINTADITGIFTADVMEEKTRRKNGEWKCKQNEWHLRNDKCECQTQEQRERRKQYEKDYFDKYGMKPLTK